MAESAKRPSPAQGTAGQGLLEGVSALVAAARCSDGKLRTRYAAAARVELSRAAEELDVLRLNLEIVERSLHGSESDG